MELLGERCGPRRPRGQLQRLLLALAAALLPALAGAGRDCSVGCPLGVDVVCGANRVSYMNPCVAECSGGVTRYSQGYCRGDRVRFAPPRNTSGAAKERAAVVAASTMAKFAAQGFAFLGHAPLSRAPLVHKLLLRKESAFSAAADAAQSDADARGSGAASGEQQFDAGAALDGIASFGAQSPAGQSVKVEVLRGDRAGNVYYKSYMYNPSASDVYSYPPQIPSSSPSPSPPAAPATPPPKATESAFVKAPAAPQPASPSPPAASPRLLSVAAGPSPAQPGTQAPPPSSPPPAQPTQAAARQAAAPRTAFGAMLASAIGFRRASPPPVPTVSAASRSASVAEGGPAPHGSSSSSSSGGSGIGSGGSGIGSGGSGGGGGGSSTGSSSSSSSGGGRAAGPGLGVSIISSKAGAVGAAAVKAAGLASHTGAAQPLTAPQRQWGGRRLQAAGEAERRAPTAAAARQAAGADGAAQHRMLTVIGSDARTACPAGRYPFGAMGQLAAKAADGTFLCSGALVAPDRVLTAAHCVWDDRQAHAFFEELSFSPAQFKSPRGSVETPEGRAEWEHVTTFKAYVDDPDLPPGLRFDIAVIKLAKPLGLKYGWLGVRAARPPCTKGGEVSEMTLAGYPGDDPFNAADDAFLGGCFLDRCRVNITCDQPMATHACDSYIGQSGAPMYDPQFYVRMVHTLGVLAGITTENSAVVIDKVILDQIMREWTQPALG